MNKLTFKLALSPVAAFIFMLQGCNHPIDPSRQDGPPAQPKKNYHLMSDPVPSSEPLSRYGNHSPYTVLGKRYSVLPTEAGYQEKGGASWYGSKFHGQRTSSWEVYDMHKLTAAHKSLPLPSYVEVTNLDNGKKIVVRVNDRGPFHSDRIIDLSYAAAHKLGMVDKGTAKVKVRAIPIDRTPPVLAHIPPLPPTQPKVTDPQELAQQQHQAAHKQYSATTQILLQAGAFGQLQSAENLKAKLRRQTNLPIEIKRHQTARQLLHRVRIGPMQPKQAQEITLMMQRMNLGKPVKVTQP